MIPGASTPGYSRGGSRDAWERDRARFERLAQLKHELAEEKTEPGFRRALAKLRAVERELKLSPMQYGGGGRAPAPPRAERLARGLCLACGLAPHEDDQQKCQPCADEMAACKRRGRRR